MGYVFISYSRRDSQLVDTLKYRLESNGIQVWVDRTDIQGGSKWRGEIVKAIEGSESMIVILSQDSIQSDNVRKELDIAEGQNSKIIPFFIESVEIPPDFKYQLVGLQRINMEGNFDAGFTQLLDALSNKPNKINRGRYQTPPTSASPNYKSVVSKYSKIIKDRKIHFLSAIPEKTLSKVYQTYASNAYTNNEVPLCLVDWDWIGSGRFGFLITNYALYWRDSMLFSGSSIALKSISTISEIPFYSLKYEGVRINKKRDVNLERISRENRKLLVSMIKELAEL